jgi:hypothetical protein
MRTRHFFASLLLVLIAPATAQVGISIGIHFGNYPDFVRIPDYPVYYAPRLDANVFFYDGSYWVYADDEWYESSWYDGPWDRIAPFAVPLFLLRVPVSYYRRPPVYFRNWRGDAPPRWGEHWGSGWERQRAGWDRWDRRSGPTPAPLPDYQRQYRGDRYPQASQQRSLLQQNYRYQRREPVARPSTPQAAPRPQAQPRPQPQPERAAQPNQRQQPAQRQQQPESRQPQQSRQERQPAPRAEQQPQQPSRQQSSQQPRATQAPAARQPAARDAAPARQDQRDRKEERQPSAQGGSPGDNGQRGNGQRDASQRDRPGKEDRQRR